MQQQVAEDAPTKVNDRQHKTGAEKQQASRRRSG